VSGASDRRRVLVAGGGVAGLEAVLALQVLGADRLDITMVTAATEFVYRPLSVAVPFGKATLTRAPLAAIAADRGFTLTAETVVAVDLEDQTVTTDHGQLGYDHLVLALGAHPDTGVTGALNFRGPRDIEALRTELERIELLGGGRIVFAARAVNSWTLPLYELALLTSTWATERSLDVELTIVVPEHTPVNILGETAGRELADLLADREITLVAAVPEGTDAGGLWIPALGGIPADLIVALPVLTGPEVPGLPRNGMRFVPVDDFCRVEGSATAYAVGDMAARQVKQGGLAAQQADVAAACIAAAAGADVHPEPYSPVLRALLVTGGEPRRFGSEITEKVPARYLSPYLATLPALAGTMAATSCAKASTASQSV
jgi:sulfide:quinone oxidoreductase